MALNFGRNLARVLRSDTGGEALVVPSMAIVIASGVVTFIATREAMASIVVAALSFPLQVMAFAHRVAATVVAVVGSLLVGAGAALLGLLVPGLGLLLGPLAGLIAGGLTFRQYRRFIASVTEADGWY